MTAITFDTLRFSHRLTQAGFSREQADALTEARKAAFLEATDDPLITKSDIRELKAEMSIIKWMMGTLIALAVTNFAKQFF